VASPIGDGGGGAALERGAIGMQAADIARPRHTPFAGRRARELRRDLTISEARLWTSLKGKHLGVRFRRQVPIGRWIADFACLDPKIVVEVDDESHYWRDERDRDQDLADRGFVVLRFWNKEVAQDLRMVIDTILATIERLES
jgi:very-short-patch-repair endonuclease